ncbi:RsmB/NOP family class I SAM-dependent RNA methyltransferase [Octadecabacter sp.]|nr:RsmB/NOP family class I SAM-dependent RNA methyltransferase [Octadecabacter sp.]
MLPAARVAAAIEVLDLILDGATPEKALTGWGRTHRFAGSKDRAAIRDHVFDALRCRASYSWIGGAGTGRGIMLGAMRAAGLETDVFTGEGHAPAPVAEAEKGLDINGAPRDVRVDMPEWLLPHFDGALKEQADAVLAQLQTRAGVFLRVNISKGTRAAAQSALAAEEIRCTPVRNINTALQVTENERRVAQSDAYLSGLVELQDPSSQKAIELLAIEPGMRVLDLCAGGGGKALAMAAMGAQVTAHDIDPRRMIDLGPRADRAGVEITTLSMAQLEDVHPFDLVLCDAPCTGSGTWRRTPAAKWALTDDRLTELTEMQDDVLDAAVPLVRSGGVLAYATCSVFEIENEARIQRFAARFSCFSMTSSHRMIPDDNGDGFYMSTMTRAE